MSQTYTILYKIKALSVILLHNYCIIWHLQNFYLQKTLLPVFGMDYFVVYGSEGM